MALDNDPQITLPLPLAINGKGASSNTDPTYNVRMLMAAENTALRELTMAEIRHVDDTQKLHVMYQEKLTIAEAKRIDAILAGNAKASETDRERAAETAQILANQVTTSAETQRSLVASTASAQASSQSQITTQQNERIGALEKYQYTGVGKSTVEDPLLAEFSMNMKSVLAVLAKGEGKSIGANSLWGYIIGGIGALAVLLKIFNIY